MRFRRVIILGNGFGARRTRAAARTRATARLISIILVNAITVNAQVGKEGDLAPLAVIPQQNDRIIPLLAPLADKASLSGDVTFAVRAQARAATLLWPYDRERARDIYRRALQSLGVGHGSTCDDSATPKAVSGRRASRLALAAIAMQSLRVELLHEIAGRDPGLAEDLAEDVARAFTAPAPESNCEDLYGRPSCLGTGVAAPWRADRSTPAHTNSDVERRDLLASVAIQIVERDPVRATALGRLSLAGGVSPHFSRLLLSLRAANAGRADVLFAYAVGCLERSRDVDLNGVHTLGAFLVSATEPMAEKPVESGVVVRFLNCALSQLSRRGQMAAGRRGDVHADQGIDAEDEAVVYFIGRQLGDLFARYMPERLGQFQSKIAESTADDSSDRAVAPAQVYDSNPNEIEREACAASTAADRDLLYARATFAWLVRGEMGRAQTSAVKITATATRDRVLAEVARRYNSAGRLDGAVAVARRIEDAAARASLMTSLAGTALASKNEALAAGLLDAAASCALPARPSIACALALSAIAGSFARLDARRGFEVMQTAVEAINEAMAQSDASGPGRSNSDAAGNCEPGALYGSSFEATFAALGRASFQRALSLAQQLAPRDISVLAQLAVCRGGLATCGTRRSAR
jgi:hypothetical protein